MAEDSHHFCLTIHINIRDILNVHFVRDCSTPRFNYHKAGLDGLYLALDPIDWPDVFEIRNTESAYDISRAACHEILGECVSLSATCDA